MDSSTPAPAAVSPDPNRGPDVHITALDVAPEELRWQLPYAGHLYRHLPGPDRPDYWIMVLDRALHFYPAPDFDLKRVEPGFLVEDRKGRPMVRVFALALAPRFVGDEFRPGMKDVETAIAYVIDTSLLGDPELTFATIEYVAVGTITDGPVPGAAPTGAPQGVEPTGRTDAPEEAPAAASVPESGDGSAADGDEAPAAVGPVAGEGTAVPGEAIARTAAHLLRAGIEAERNGPLERLVATLTLDAQYRVIGLSGNADGQPPVPTVATFPQISRVLKGFEADPATAGIRVVRFQDDANGTVVELTS